MSDIDLTEAVEAAFDETLTERCLVALDDRADSSHIWTLLQEALTAALPHIARQVREQVAREIEAVDPVEWALAGQSAGADAARIARGDS